MNTADFPDFPSNDWNNKRKASSEPLLDFADWNSAVWEMPNQAERNEARIAAYSFLKELPKFMTGLVGLD